MYKALEGATFLLTEPPYTVLGYYEGDRLVPLLENEQFWIIYRDNQYPLRWECDLEYLQNPECQAWIYSNEQWTQVPSRHFFVGDRLPVLQLPQPPAAEQPVAELPAVVLPAPLPLLPMPVQEEQKVAPQPYQPAVVNEARGPLVQPKRCQDCQAQVTQYMEMGSVCCVKCLLAAITSGRCSTQCHQEMPWSEGIIYDVMIYLHRTLSDQDKSQLPGYYPLPRDHFVCIGKDKPFKPNYPPRGHIIGKSAFVAEGGCPNNHVLCQSCAASLTSCPQCNAFIAFEVSPQGCPTFPNSDQHCADFDRACGVSGCTGGRWSRRKVRH